MTQRLEKLLGYTFENPDLLTRALITISYANENGLSDEQHQEAFRTLGDAVINVIIVAASIAYGRSRKGKITDDKKLLVSKASLNRLAKAFHLEKYVQWGKGERVQKIWTVSDKPLAECFEAIIGAIYLDAGMAETEEIFWRITKTG
ncbi:MAG: ribonuclease III domain-containing protein [Promethearchaeota archaeon]